MASTSLKMVIEGLCLVPMKINKQVYGNVTLYVMPGFCADPSLAQKPPATASGVGAI